LFFLFMEFSRRYNPVYRTLVAPTAVYLATVTLAAELAGIQGEALAHGSVCEVLDSALAYSRGRGNENREADMQEATIAMLAGGAVVRLCAENQCCLEAYENYYQDLLGSIPADCPDAGLALQLDC
jgi:hypothetical protein